MEAAPYLEQSDFADIVPILAEHKSVFKTEYADSLITLMISAKEYDALDSMLELTTKKGKYRSSPAYNNLLEAYANTGTSVSLISLLGKGGYNETDCRSAIKQAFNTDHQTTVYDLGMALKADSPELFDKLVGDIFDGLAKQEMYKQCQSLIDGIGNETWFIGCLVKEMASNGQRTKALNYVRSKKQLYMDNGEEFSYNLHQDWAKTW